MAQYLDASGLQEFWDGIKPKIAAKQDKLTAGTNITISSSNVISATGGGGGVTVDDTLSDSSENPVQNKVIKSALDGKQGTLTAGTGINIASNTVSQAAPESVTVTKNTANIGDGKATTAATITVYKSGHIVNLYATWTMGSSAASSWVTLATGLPVPSMAPIYNAAPSYNSNSVACNTAVTASGQFNIRYGTANRVYYMNMCYLA